MVAIHVCDICKADGKLVETTLYRKVTGRPELRLDVCKGCDRIKVPKDFVGYVKLVYRVVNRIELSNEDAVRLSKR